MYCLEIPKFNLMPLKEKPVFFMTIKDEQVLRLMLNSYIDHSPFEKHETQFTDNVPGILGEHYDQCCSSHPTHSRWQYRDHRLVWCEGFHNELFQMCNPFLSCLLSFHTIPTCLLLFYSKMQKRPEVNGTYNIKHLSIK